MLVGCSTKFVYRNADWLIYWYVDDYISLTDEQEARFDEYLQLWLSWHKSEELDKYITQLNHIKADIESGNISVERLEQHQTILRAHWHRVRDKIAPDLADIAPMFNQVQLDNFFSKLAEYESKSKQKRQKLSEKNQRKRWLNEHEDNLTRWIGDLNDKQEKLIVDLYDNQLSTAQLRAEFRNSYQSQLKVLFTQASEEKQLKTRLLKLLVEPESFKGAELIRRDSYNGLLRRQFVVDVYQSLTAKQLQHLNEELDELIEVLFSLKK
jgi:chromosome segregation ATPase